MSVKGRLLGALGGLALREGRVGAVIPLSAQLRRIEVQGLGDASWCPGDKVELVLDGHAVRTYTPIGWHRGTATFLIASHGTGPGAAWARSVKEGDPVRLFGPRPSVQVSGPAVVFGDETAFGLAAALGARGVYEVTDLAGAGAFLADRPDDVAIPRDGERHLDAVADAIGTADTVVLAGRARSIQALKRRLRGPRPVVKAYWAEGKAGLD